jgi:hypothetical protein
VNPARFNLELTEMVDTVHILLTVSTEG